MKEKNIKFLGLRLCEHDSNMSFFDGDKVFYYKLERHTRIKHDAYDNFELWISEIKKIWGITLNDLDEIGIVFDPWAYKLKDKEFFPSTNFKYLPYNITRINHHYAHALSCWPINNKCKTHIVFDAYGDYNISWTTFKNDKIFDIGYVNKQGSLGLAMNLAATILNIEPRNSYDVAGKVMGLQSYGHMNNDYLKKLHNFDINQINIVFDFNLWKQHIGDNLLAELKKIDWIRTVHFYVGKLLLNYFTKVIDNDDDYISYSGGCAQNVVWNTTLKNKFKNLIIPPHCSDEGLSLGVIDFFRRKYNLPFFKLNNFPFSQGGK